MILIKKKNPNLSKKINIKFILVYNWYFKCRNRKWGNLINLFINEEWVIYKKVIVMIWHEF